MTTLEDRKAQLLARRAELVERSEEVEAELDAHHNPDWEELATEREGDEVLESMGVSAAAEIRAIDAALSRLEAGEYGVCVKCGEYSSAERLDVVPHAPLCKACARG